MRGKGVPIGVAVALVLSGAPALAQAASGSISGTVTDSAGQPLADICVEASENSSWNWGDAITGSDGTYRIDGLPDGSYVVLFSGCSWDSPYLWEWYDDRRDWASADEVPVAGGDVAGIDATLTLGGTITGTVTNEQGEPIARACVYAASDQWGGYAETAPDGTYAVVGLRDGDYRVEFSDCYQGRYLSEWYDDRPDWESADPVSVAEETTVSDIDAVLTAGGTISGRVTSGRGEPLEDICVEVFDSSGAWGQSAVTDLDGTYTVGPLVAGSYRVEFFDCGWRWDGSRFRAEWYDDKASFDAADPVAVALRTDTTGIDAHLAVINPADLAVSELTVQPAPIRTDLAELGPSPHVRRVFVELYNLGDADASDAELRLWACTASDRTCRDIDSASVGVRAGERLGRWFTWNALGMVGDVTVFAAVCPEFDSDLSNNVARTDHYVGVGGTGAGRTVGEGYTWSEDSLRHPCGLPEGGFFWLD